jgi:(S)-ureidoglycine aminohydrolase
VSDRGFRGDGHVVLTPANRYPSRLPWLPEAIVYKLVSPRLEPARFSQQLVCLDEAPAAPAGPPPGPEQFLYLLSGRLRTRLDGAEQELSAGAFSYCPPGGSLEVVDASEARVVRVHRLWAPLAVGHPPEAMHGHRDEHAADATPVAGLTRRELLPAGDPSFDFTISIMRFAPGSGLDQVEIHDEEHGLYMLAGGGRYLLGNGWHEVAADDFIYMAPYCPQSFVAGPEGAEYLLYKDVFRDLP